VALFFCSGASALIYQVIWLRKLGLVFGVTVFAASTVWASFMSGLAIGSLLAGAVADRVRRPLLWFAGAEALIGVSALLTPFGLDLFQSWYASIHPSIPHNAFALTTLRVMATLAVLFVPTVLMGATLPLVIKSSLIRSARLGPRVGTLYATNTAGAIIGTLGAGLFLIPRFGMGDALLYAAVLNLSVAACAVLVALAQGRMNAGVTPAEEAAGDTALTDDLARPARLTVLAVFAVSGFTSLAIEVIWFRVIVLLIRPTVYGFAMMLAILLFGIAAGSYLAAPLLRRPRRWMLPLAIIELAMAVVAVFSVQLLTFHPALVAWAVPRFGTIIPSYHVVALLASLLTIFPTALLMGIAFPIGLRLWTGEHDDPAHVGRRIGIFYSLNVTGSIFGSLAAGFVLLPLLGSGQSLVLVAALIFCSGLALLLHAGLAGRQRFAAVAVAVAAFAGTAAAVEDPFDLFLRLRYPNQEVVWREEGIQGTVSVHRDGEHLLLHLEGNHQASDIGGARGGIHRTIGHLPMALHPEPREALVIGLGGGATAGAVSTHEGVQVDVVELSPGVVRAAEFFAHINEDVLNRPNVRVLVDDGRNYLLTTPKKYDVITADLILPIFSGAGNLYSVEYFRLVRDGLKNDGMAVQWVWGTEAEYKSIMRSFLAAFPNATLWAGGQLMIGTKEPLRLRRSDFEWKLTMPGRAAALRELGFDSFDKLTDSFFAGPAAMRAFTRRAPLLTDDRPLTEYFLSLPRDRDIDVTPLRLNTTPPIIEN
jgi:spermidine synthase